MSLSARISGQIDRWMTSPALYRWALQNPVGRWITRRRADALFELMAGFVHSQVLLACVRLRLLEKVLDAPASADELGPGKVAPQAHAFSVGTLRLTALSVTCRISSE